MLCYYNEGMNIKDEILLEVVIVFITNSDYLTNVTGNGEYKIKLKQVETDWVDYKKIILEDKLQERMSIE